jgi:hypothetical protein
VLVRQRPTDWQLTEWRDERDALARMLLANPNDPQRRRVKQRLRVLAFMMKRYDHGRLHQPFLDLGQVGLADELSDRPEPAPSEFRHPPVSEPEVPVVPLKPQNAWDWGLNPQGTRFFDAFAGTRPAIVALCQFIDLFGYPPPGWTFVDGKTAVVHIESGEKISVLELIEARMRWEHDPAQAEWWRVGRFLARTVIRSHSEAQFGRVVATLLRIVQ